MQHRQISNRLAKFRNRTTA